GNVIEDGLDDVVAGLVFRFGLVAHNYAMAKHRRGNVLDVLRSHKATAGQECTGLCAEGEHDRGPGRCAVLDEMFDIEFELGRLPGGEYDRDDVVLDFVVDVNVIECATGRSDVGGGHDGLHAHVWSRHRHAVENQSLLGS